MFVLVTLALMAADGHPAAGDAGIAPLEPKEIAISFARALLAGDADALAAQTPSGFAFDGRQTWSLADARAEWVHALEQRSLAGVQLYGVDVLSYEDMLKRYGKPPARLSQLNLTGTRIAVVDLGGRALILIFKKHGDSWTPMAVSD